MIRALGRQGIKAYLRTPFRGKSRLMDMVAPFLTPRTGVESVRIGDYTLCLDHRIRATQLMAYHWYERSDLEFVASIVPKGGTVFDLGANVGYCSAHFAKMVGEKGRVFSFEPSPTCLVNLRKLEQSSDSGVIRIVPRGVAETTRETTYFETERTISHGYGRLDDRPSDRHNVTREETVAVTSIDDFCEEESIEHIDFIKIDVEGAERQVLHGMANTFARGEFPPLMIEMTGGEPTSQEREDIQRELTQHGYKSFSMYSRENVDVLTLGKRFHGNILWKRDTDR